MVSHGHGATVQPLVGQLAALRDAHVRRVILTLNTPEPALVSSLDGQEWPFELQLVRNPVPRGFAANHNSAFALDTQRGASTLFAVLNPDIRLHGNPFGGLLQRMAQGGARVGLCYPVQRGEDGRQQDHERLLPTPTRLLRRHWPGAPQREVPAGTRPDWVNAAFLLLRRDAYASVGGFDERYHMYCEDVDLCLRLQLTGWRLARADEVVVVHGAQRASRRRPQHLAWHVCSLLRLWRSRAWRAYRAGMFRHADFQNSDVPR